MQQLPIPVSEIRDAPPIIIPQTEIISQPDVANQSTVDILRQKITELESQLAEARERPLPEVFDMSALPMGNTEVIKTEATKVTRLPVINRQGVTISSDSLQRIRIEVMDSVLFMPNTWQLTAEGEETLRAIAAEIRAFDPQTNLDVEGHTDSLMSDPRNPMQKHDISSTKSTAVMEFFVNTLRWDVARIGASSFGRSRPVADNGTPEGRARNNRIEIVLRGGSG